MYFLYKIVIVLLIFAIFGCKRESITEPVNDGIPPETPVGLTVTYAADGEIRIEWQKNNEAGINGYNIYRSINDTLSFLNIGFSKSDFYFDDSLNYDSVYSYRISAIDIFGLESNLSEIVTAKPVNIYYPLTVRELNINARNWHDGILIVLNWKPSGETDIKNYLIYRSNKSGLNVSNENLLDSCRSFSYNDTTNLKLSKKYYYKVVVQDKGGLLSRPSYEVSDIILNKPKLIFPVNDDTLTYFNSFTIKSVSAPAKYRITIQSNPITGILYSKTFYSSEIDSEIKIPLDNFVFDTFKTYYWQVFTFTSSDYNPNSISDISSFTIVQNP